jgi:hypothetical protein
MWSTGRFRSKVEVVRKYPMGSPSGLEEDQQWLPIQNDGVRHAATSISSPPFQQREHPASTVRLPNEELATLPHLTTELSLTWLTKNVDAVIGSAMNLACQQDFK